MASFKKLQTRAAHDAGALLNVLDQSGEPTGETIRVRGVDSDAFAVANRKAQRALLAYIEKNPKATGTPEYDEFVENNTRELRASLVMEWSFEEPCTKENVLDLFREAPYLAKAVDEFAGKRGNFVSSSPSSSETTPSSSST